jgi:hypothetical protein
MKRFEQDIQKALASQDEMRAAGAEITVAVGIRRSSRAGRAQ